MKIEGTFTQCNISLPEELELTREPPKAGTIRSPRWEGTDVGAFMCTNFVHNGCVGGHNVFPYDFSHLGVEFSLYFIGYSKNFLLVLNLPEGRFGLFCKAMEK